MVTHTRSSAPALALLLAALALPACAPAIGADGGPVRRSNPSVLNQDELREVQASNAYDIVLRLRPHWFRERGHTPGELTIFLDGARYGDASSLRRIPPDLIRSMQFLSPSEVRVRMLRYQAEGVSAAILISTIHSQAGR